MFELLMGDEAIGLGAVQAGIRGAFSYPGTPATEILEYVQRHAHEKNDLSAQWSANEKVAYEEALGMSFVGHRALVSMKHVGLNVAADPFMSSALTGANGGLVLAVADDPHMHSSQNEQDSRYYGRFAQIPLFEPGNQQEAYDMTREAFEVSERFHVPVIVRLVTRLAHSRGNVTVRPPLDHKPLPRANDWRDWTLLPVNARRRYARLLDLQQDFHEFACDSKHNEIKLAGSNGIIMSGIASGYVREVLGTHHGWSTLKLGVYPIPRPMVRELVDHCDSILVVEEGYPFIEQQLIGLLGIPGKQVRGRLSGALPRQGELSVDVVKSAVGMTPIDSYCPTEGLPPRPPQLCNGCPHCDTYRAVLDAAVSDRRPYFFSDIGCYTLAALPPHNAIDTCVDMGASIGMAVGAAKAGAETIVATIGDSTFIHSGISALIGAARENSNITVVILDNATVAMTGGQEVLTTGDDLMRLLHGLGIPDGHLIRLKPLPRLHDETVGIIRREIAFRGLSVIVACRPCIHLKSKKTQEQAVASESH